MKAAKKSNYLEWNKNAFVSSIKKINLNFFLIIFLDMLFYALSGFLVAFWLQRVTTKLTLFNFPTENIVSLGYEKAQQLTGEIRSLYYLIIFSFVLLLVAIIFLASILKGIIWAKTTNTKISLKLVSKFLELNLIWMSFWFVVLISITLFVEQAFAPKLMIFALILAIYFTNTLYTIFMKEQKLKAITGAIKLNISKIHLFLLPYAGIFILFFALTTLSSFIKFRYSAILFSLIILVYAAFVRYYASALVLEIEKFK